MITLRGSLVALLLTAAACGGSAPSSSAPVPRADPYVITREEMQSPVILSMDAYKAIQYLRPTFLRTGGPQSFSNTAAGLVQFSHDFGPLRPVTELTTLRTDLLYEVRYLNANEATLRFGINANGGPVIVLLSNKQP